MKVLTHNIIPHNIQSGENQVITLYDLLGDKKGDAYKGRSLSSLKSSHTTDIKLGEILPSQEIITVRNYHKLIHPLFNLI